MASALALALICWKKERAPTHAHFLKKWTRSRSRSLANERRSFKWFWYNIFLNVDYNSNWFASKCNNLHMKVWKKKVKTIKLWQNNVFHKVSKEKWIQKERWKRARFALAQFLWAALTLRSFLKNWAALTLSSRKKERRSERRSKELRSLMLW